MATMTRKEPPAPTGRGTPTSRLTVVLLGIVVLLGGRCGAGPDECPEPCPENYRCFAGACVPIHDAAAEESADETADVRDAPADETAADESTADADADVTDETTDGAADGP